MRASEIKPDLKVYVKPAGEPQAKPSKNVGTVDHIEGERFIKLKCGDSTDGEHHWIPLDWADRVEGEILYLNKDEDEFRAWALDDNPVSA